MSANSFKSDKQPFKQTRASQCFNGFLETSNELKTFLAKEFYNFCSES